TGSHQDTHIFAVRFRRSRSCRGQPCPRGRNKVRHGDSDTRILQQFRPMVRHRFRSEQRGDTPDMSVVWSCNEWDPLEEVIVGNPLGARFPTPDKSSQVAEFPDRSLSEIPRGPFSQQIIEETEEDLNEFVRILEKQGVTVKRPETWPHEKKF